MSLHLHFPETGWDQAEEKWSAWWEGELERALVVLECVQPQDATTPHYASTYLANFGLDASPEEILDVFVPRLQATYYLGDAFPRFWPNYGPGSLATCAGACLHTSPDTTWFSPSFNGKIGELHVDIARRDAWWHQTLAITRAAVERWGDQLSIGMTDLGGNLDILASLRGTQALLYDLNENPGGVDRLVGEISRLWLACYEEQSAITRYSRGITCWGPCWSPGPGYMLQSDFSYMISPRMFKRYVMPDLAVCCEALDYPFYHLDGRGQIPHLDHLLSLERLRGIQWVPGDGQPQAEHWLPLLKRIRDASKLCQVSVSAQGALTILRELGGKGMLLVISENLARLSA
jgi:5-methyltetrahydrofolate--homocysteine methyltransferase